MAEDISKLPKWAQWRLDKLHKDLAGARAEISNLTSAKPTKICVEPANAYLQEGLGSYFLPERATVRYTLAKGWIDVDLRDNELRITADGATTHLVIRPQASNALILKMVSDKEEA